MSAFKFIGREDELKTLRSLAGKKSASLIVIRGRRRIGKSRLVEEFAKGQRFLRFSGLPPKTGISAQDERDEFARQLAHETDLPELKADDWGKLFRLLADQTKDGRVVILFDEISWMGTKDPLFLGQLKNAWDIDFKKNSQLILIFCGSVSSWIDENILKSTGFMGRLSLVLDLGELSIHECDAFLKAAGMKGAAYEKFKILSVTGGIPRYLEEIKPLQSAEENIKNLCFRKSGILTREFKDIFLDIFAKRNEVYKKIVESLVTGAKDFYEILDALKMQKSGRLTDYLSDLILSGFIRRDYTWNLKGAKASKLSHYRLSDNYLRFYLKYIQPNQAKIERDDFRYKSLTSLPGIESIFGLQFENLVLNNRAFIWEALNIHAGDIVTDNPYFQKAQVRKRACQIDYLIQTNTNVLYACEIKFSKQELGTKVVNNMRTKLANLYLPRGFSLMPILIHVNGVTDAVTESEYFHQIIDFGELLEK